MTMKRRQAEQLKAVPDPLENQQRAARKPERETYAVYRLPDDDADASAEREFLLTLPIDVDVERRIKRDYGAGSYRVEHRRGGRFVSVTEMHFDELPQREDVGGREGDAPEDFDERVAQAVEDVLEARRDRARARALRPNTAPSVPLQQPAAAAPDPLNDLVRTVAVLKQLGVPIGEVSPRAAATEAPKEKDEDDRVLLSLLRDRSLRQRITSSIASMVGDPDASAPQAWYLQVMQTLEAQPKLATKIIGLIDRVLPAMREDSGDDGEAADSAASVEDKCTAYLVEQCAANAVVTFKDAPLQELAEKSPDNYQELVDSLKVASVDQIIEHMRENFAGARLVLSTPHARSWIERLKEAAVST
jgi:hypothetical protein